MSDKIRVTGGRNIPELTGAPLVGDYSLMREGTEKTRIGEYLSAMQVAILAGGLGTRLGALTIKQAKSMVRIEGRPFLEYQLDFLRRAGVADIVLCVGHLGEQIEDYFGDGKSFGVNIRYSLEGRPLGTAGALKNAEHLLEDVFFVVYGDSYLLLDLSQVMAYFESQNKLALMTVYKNYGCYDKSNTAIEGNLVKRYSKKEKTEEMVYIDYGASIFRKKSLELIPEKQPYSLDDLFTGLVEQKQLLAFEVKERFYEIGSPQGFREFEQFVQGA